VHPINQIVINNGAVAEKSAGEPIRTIKLER
jgi:hypothetical protein